MFALDNKEEALCRSPSLHGLVWLSMGKLGGIRNFWVLSETLPAIQVSFRSLGADGRKRENTYGIHRSEENLGRAEPQTLQPPQQKPPDGTTLNEEETPREVSPKSKEACLPLSRSVFEGGNSRNPSQEEKIQGMQWALYSLPNHSSTRSK